MAKRQKPILVADDLSERSHVVRARAAALATPLGAPMDVVHIGDETCFPTEQPQARKLMRELIQSQQRRLKAEAALLTPRSRTFVIAGSPAASILELLSRRPGYELAVVGTRGHTGLKRMLLGSVAEEVVRNARVPVMTVGAAAQSGEAPSPEAPIFLATDLGPNARRAEAYAASLAKRLGLELVLFHSLFSGFHPVLQTAFASPSPPRQMQQLFEEMKSVAFKQIESRSRKLSRAGIQAHAELDDSLVEAQEAILKAIQRLRPAYVVLGTHGRNLFLKAFLGSTAREVIHDSPVPVITVRSRG